MATIADYPDGIGTAGPHISVLSRNPIEFKRRLERNEDGGVTAFVQPCGLLIFDLIYEGLGYADWETLYNHFNLAKGRVNNFEFYARDSATTFAGAKYISFELPQQRKHWWKDVRIRIGIFQ